MSRRLFTTASLFSRLSISNQKTVILRNSRLLSNGNPTGTITTCPVTFNDGFFRFKVDNNQFVLSFWTPVNQVADVIRLVSLTQPSNQSTQEGGTNVAEPAVKVLDMNNEEVITGVEPTALGTVFTDSGTLVVSTGSESSEAKPVQLKLEGMVDEPRNWMLKNSPQKPFDVQVRSNNLLFNSLRNANIVHNSVLNPIRSSHVHNQPTQLHVLEKEKESIVASYSPMEDEFMTLLVDSETQAQKRFKWGGLFLLSAQLGFVARLTWFEYSWDIMEPITWCLTYSMMLGTFSYYIFTAQEFMLPLVERRAVQERFWKNVRKSHFDVNQFKQLRTQLIAIERRAKRVRSTPFASSIPLS